MDRKLTYLVSVLEQEQFAISEPSAAWKVNYNSSENQQVAFFSRNDPTF